VDVIDEKILATLGNRAVPLPNCFDCDAPYIENQVLRLFHYLCFYDSFVFVDCFIVRIVDLVTKCSLLVA